MGFVVVHHPGNSEGSPNLSDVPVFVEEASSVKVLVFAEEVVVRDPEVAVIAEAVVKSLEPLGCPFFGSVAWDS